MQVDFRAPARLDDALQVTCALRECRRASLVFAQEVRRDGALLLDATVRVAALNASDILPRAIPEPLLRELRALQGVEYPSHNTRKPIDGATPMTLLAGLPRTDKDMPEQAPATAAQLAGDADPVAHDGIHKLQMILHAIFPVQLVMLLHMFG